METVLYFKEYTYHNADGSKVHPYFSSKTGRWILDGITYAFSEIGEICGIPEDELIILRLTYGV